MSKKTRVRQRFQYKFWLDAYVQAEYSIMETIEVLKAERKFAATMRNALRLIIDLSSGNIEVLLELFPWVVERVGAAQPAPIAHDNTDILREIQRLQEMINERSIPDTSNDYPQMQKAAPKPTTGKQLAAPSFAMPVFDDDDDTPTVIVNRSTDMSSAANFLTALQHMQ